MLGIVEVGLLAAVLVQVYSLLGGKKKLVPVPVRARSKYVRPG